MITRRSTSRQGSSRVACFFTPPVLFTLHLVEFRCLIVFFSLCLIVSSIFAVELPTTTRPVLEKHCYGCHDAASKEGGLDLRGLRYEPDDQASFSKWVKIHDRVQKGEMPPKDIEERPDAKNLKSFLDQLRERLEADDLARIASKGRAIQRRLNRHEFENVLRDLFQSPWLQIRSRLPEDGEAHRFNKIGEALDVSHVQMARFMSSADYAIQEILGVRFAQLEFPTFKTQRYYAREQPSLTRFAQSIFIPNTFWRTFPVLGTTAQPEVRALREPTTVGESDQVIREQEASGLVSSAGDGFFYLYDNFRAPVGGRYRVRFKGYTLWVGPYGYARSFTGESDKVGTPKPPEWWRPNPDDVSVGRRNEPITVYGQTQGLKRRLGSFEFATEPTVCELDLWLLAGEQLLPDAARLLRAKASASLRNNPFAQRDGQPGIAHQWMEVEGPLYDDSSLAGYRLLFGDLPLVRLDDLSPMGTTLDVFSIKTHGKGGAGGRRDKPVKRVKVEVVSADPQADAERLLRAFMRRAYRRPVVQEDVQIFLDVIHQALDAKLGFADAMIAGYTAVLSSPGFVFLEEQPGRLDDYALASRLSFFLWNSEPDAALRGHAERGELARPEVLRAETERLLNDPKSERFVEAFLDYWLDLRKIDLNSPSLTLYPDYEADDLLNESALDESRLYFADVLRHDRPASTIVDSDFTFLNERLALHYGIPEVSGVAMRRVVLPTDSVRGGLLTQASVLKVTANGTTTSPVLRGKWIVERILGREIPPPPPVAAIEPDIRGAVTIREQLDKHRADPSCAACHSIIDPPGFALECFDVFGGYRDRYRATSYEGIPEKGFGRNGVAFAFHLGRPVDASGQTEDGRPFHDIREFKRLLLTDEKQIACNLVQQLAIYATGAPLYFSDRVLIDGILERARPENYGVRNLVHELIQSDMFLRK